mmetsp:Transcript_3002/g.7195  ORF Transcript_3002/g.7195 Transcript_3002/m.7195 type:complete len:341 (-) Transcript_3002:801-1823(-)
MLREDPEAGLWVGGRRWIRVVGGKPRRFPEGVPIRSKERVEVDPRSVLAVAIPVVQVVVEAGREVVLVSRVGRRGGEDHVKAHPKDQKRRESARPGKDHGQHQQGTVARVVIQVLDRVHGQSRKGFRIGGPVVQRMHVLVQEAQVEEPVGNVKVQVAVGRDGDRQEQRLQQPPPARRCMGEGECPAAVQVQKGALGQGPLHDSQNSIIGVVEDFFGSVGTVRHKRTCADSEPVQDPVPESNVGQCPAKIDTKSSPERVPQQFSAAIVDVDVDVDVDFHIVRHKLPASHRHQEPGKIGRVQKRRPGSDFGNRFGQWFRRHGARSRTQGRIHKIASAEEGSV